MPEIRINENEEEEKIKYNKKNKKLKIGGHKIVIADELKKQKMMF